MLLIIFFLVENIIPDVLQVAELKEVLSSLIEENISIKDIVYIFEKINDVIAFSDKNELLKKLRIALKAQISSYYANQENIIYGYKLNDKLVKYLETIFNKNLKENSFNKQKLKQVATKIKKILLRNEIDRVVIFTNANIREIFYNILKLYIDNTIVLAYEEIDDNFNVCIIDEI
ncbi:MAG: FHIPEP family type III secretion protein [Candidatus Melainabacteria bacterium]|nr:MAG: FHIPEP family type III secretion protein [Candidatus Melainabacteria bacterium]